MIYKPIQGGEMTLIIENADDKILTILNTLKALKPELTIRQDNKKSDFELVSDELMRDLEKPENYAVFERLKDKWDM